ncbi:MAG TPA: hypothetical protein PLE61_15385 [Vicinamibacterales bacterium]|nr:hypothetical protein [Vicinamibacterales bacterium]
MSDTDLARAVYQAARKEADALMREAALWRTPARRRAALDANDRANEAALRYAAAKARSEQRAAA